MLIAIGLSLPSQLSKTSSNLDASSETFIKLFKWNNEKFFLNGFCLN